MDSDPEGKREPVDPEALLRTVEMELLQQRAFRQHSSTRWAKFRVLSFAFLFAVLMGGGFALYYVFSSGRLEEMRSQAHATPTPAANSPVPR